MVHNCDYKKGTGRPALEHMVGLDQSSLPVYEDGSTAEQCVLQVFDRLLHMSSSVGIQAMMAATASPDGKMVRYSFSAAGAATRGGANRISDLFWKFVEDAELAHGAVKGFVSKFEGDKGYLDLRCPKAVTYRPEAATETPEPEKNEA